MGFRSVWAPQLGVPPFWSIAQLKPGSIVGAPETSTCFFISQDISPGLERMASPQCWYCKDRPCFHRYLQCTILGCSAPQLLAMEGARSAALAARGVTFQKLAQCRFRKQLKGDRCSRAPPACAQKDSPNEKSAS